MSKYKWHEMTFFTRWDADYSTVFCIGADAAFERLLHESLRRMWKDLPSANPWSLQVPLLERIVALQDSAVWLVRDVVRNVEKVRSVSILRVPLTDARTACDPRVNMTISYDCTKPPGTPRIVLKPLVYRLRRLTHFSRKLWGCPL